MKKSVELIRYLKEERLLKCSLVAGKLIQGAITRSKKGSGSDSEVQRTMLELLNQLDGFELKQDIKVIKATNRIDTDIT